MARLDNKVALVTGAAHGIGRSTAIRFAQEGAAVVIADLVESAAHDVANTIKNSGGRALAIAYDAAVEDQADAAIQASLHEFGPLDIAVLGAGVVSRPLESVSDESKTYPEYLRFDAEDWSDVFAVNVTGTYLMVQAASRAMLDLGVKGSIVTITSVAAADPSAAANPAYAVSKAAVWTLTKNLAPRLAAHGIRLNAVAPGITDTNMIAGLAAQPDHLAAALSKVPMARIAHPEEVTNAILFLASDEASFITGESVYVDGGFFTG